ncbi:MAG: triose-phosphate isomerase [Syntrophales bacterium]
MTRPLIAANWKMHKTVRESTDFMEGLIKAFAQPTDRDIVVAPPFTAIHAVSKIARGTAVGIAAQNMFWEKEGAYTGEISAPMLVEAGCEYVIIGHSERRRCFGEDDPGINRKIKKALEFGLRPIFCLGESLEEREGGKTFPVIERQIREGLNNIPTNDIERIIIAYEPVWAIGTGKTATPDQAEQAHFFIRTEMAKICGKEMASRLAIIYGGSVSPANIGGLMAEPDINGALVGGASLDLESFIRIVRFDRP